MSFKVSEEIIQIPIPDGVHRSHKMLLENYSDESAKNLLKEYEQSDENLLLQSFLGDFLEQINMIYQETDVLEIEPIQQIAEFLHKEKFDVQKISSILEAFLRDFSAKFVLVNDAFEQICRTLGIQYHPVFEFSEQESHSIPQLITLEELVDELEELNHDAIRDVIQEFLMNVNIFQNINQFRCFVEYILRELWENSTQIKEFYRAARLKSLFVEVMKLEFGSDATGFTERVETPNINGLQAELRYMEFLLRYERAAFHIDFRHFEAAGLDPEKALAEPPTPPPPTDEVLSPEARDADPPLREPREPPHRAIEKLRPRRERVNLVKPSSTKPVLRFQEIDVNILQRPGSPEYEGIVRELVLRFQDMQLNQFVDEVWALYRIFINKHVQSEDVLRFIERVLHPIWQECLINKSRLRNGRIQEVWKALQLETRDKFYVLMVRSNQDQNSFDGHFVGGYNK